MQTTAQLRVHIRQLCCLGLPGEQLMPPLLKAVRELVGADSAAFFWVDTQGEMTKLYSEKTLPEAVMKVYFDRYYVAGESAFRRAFNERARQPEPVMAVEPTPEMERSPYYTDIMQRLDAHYVLYGVVREQGQPIGQLSLYRSKRTRPFGAAQKAELASIIHYIEHGVGRRARPLSVPDEFLDASDDAVFLIRQDGAVATLPLAAQKLLSLATRGRIGRDEAHGGVAEGAQPVLRRLADRLCAAARGEEGTPPMEVIDNTWGRFVLRAYAISDGPFDGTARFAVRIHRQEPMLLRFVGALGELGLSPKQREIAAGLARGATNQELAEALGVSVNTIAYHIKQLFARLDTHDRQEMIGKVLGRSPGGGEPPTD
jgi:DNA-binding CsgD family transcriptional regulator